MCGGVGANTTFVFFSIVRHASTQLRTPAPRGMASQHLRTFERVPSAYSLFAGTVPAVYSLFAGTVPAFNLFLNNYWQLFHSIRNYWLKLFRSLIASNLFLKVIFCSLRIHRWSSSKLLFIVILEVYILGLWNILGMLSAYQVKHIVTFGLETPL